MIYVKRDVYGIRVIIITNITYVNITDIRKIIITPRGRKLLKVVIQNICKSIKTINENNNSMNNYDRINDDDHMAITIQ